MERMRITMSESDIDLFERKRTELGMSKSSFVRLLLAEYENKVPPAIKYKEIISELAAVNTALHEILISGEFDTSKKMLLDEKIKALAGLIREKILK